MPNTVLKFQPRNSNHNIQRLTERFTNALRKSVEGIIEAGQVLLDGKDELEHGEFIKWVEILGISARTAQTMMLISRNPIVSNAKNYSYLPACSKSLYELCQIPKARLIELLEKGKINPGQTISEIVALRKGAAAANNARSSFNLKLKAELRTLVDAAIVLGGADVTLHYLRNINDITKLDPSPSDVDDACRWVKQKLRTQ